MSIGVQAVYPVIGGVHHTGQLLSAQLTLMILKWSVGSYDFTIDRVSIIKNFTA